MQGFKHKTDNVCWTELPAFLFARTTEQIARVSQQMTDTDLCEAVSTFLLVTGKICFETDE